MLALQRQGTQATQGDAPVDTGLSLEVASAAAIQRQHFVVLHRWLTAKLYPVSRRHRPGQVPPLFRSARQGGDGWWLPLRSPYYAHYGPALFGAAERCAWRGRGRRGAHRAQWRGARN